MGKKIPMWQTIMVMLVMIGLLVWSIVKDSGGINVSRLILEDAAMKSRISLRHLPESVRCAVLRRCLLR